MTTPASVRNHPLHPILVGLPIGLWVFAVVSDLVHLLGWGGPIWKEMARYTIGGGIVGALLAAVPGLIDFTSIHDRSVRRIAMTHMVVNLAVVALFALSFWLRVGEPLGGWPVAVAVAALVLLGVGGWLGGELVFVHGMGVKAVETAANRAARRRTG